ncbi:hypothetical protein KO537_15140 [Shewanella sp. NKUCC01_JLK]|uniref:hypothetical protein n=1 Tax=Shewanella sp. NKUCC01_JLK TaxID=2842123 RepID=UPI001C5A637C|nr:hypothetical protein [Shewanella sp. NKUCC01_JLK]MBW3516042.1 hypothetical protein [Shewanella sp. NKUCC01_JLK]
MSDFRISTKPVTNACNFARVNAAQQRYERESWMTNWQLDMEVVRLGESKGEGLRPL